MTNAKTLSGIVNGVNVDNLFSTIDAIKTTPAIAKFTFRIRNRWDGASQNRSTVSEFYGAGQEQSRRMPFVLHADEPAILLGKDEPANPLEHLLHAPASCLTTSMVYHAVARGIQIEEVESSLDGDIDLHGFLNLDRSVRRGYQGIRVNFKIKAFAADQQLQEIAQPEMSYSRYLIR
jgi:uncharacterized OsmC-like protein